MENRRPLISALLVLFLAVNAFAYNNMGPHQRINEIALQRFTDKIMPSDPYLKNASLDGASCKGIAWDVSDGVADLSPLEYSQVIAVDRVKSMQNWIIDGGFSADEPEIPMALRHFYDPVRTPSYLTDYVKLYGIPHPEDPKTSAVDWAFTPSENLYSYAKGKEYFTLALADAEPGNVNYGKAWRSVGETMHLVSDMTVPAHVRNDGHIPKFDPDIYETTIGTSTIDAYMDGPIANLNYKCTDPKGKDLKTLMQDVAKWTNENFFSKDTVPQPDSDVTANKNEKYPSPGITGEQNSNGYYYRKIENYRNYDDSDASLSGMMRLATTQVTGVFFKKTIYKIDHKIVVQQKEILIPTAIRASESVLDAFLPRFTVKIDSAVNDPKNPGKKIVSAHIEHILTKEWPGDLTIGNGAHIVVGNTDNLLKLVDNLDNDRNQNRIKYSVPAKEGDKISVYYDLGGYKTGAAGQKSVDMESLILTPEDAPPGLKLEVNGPLDVEYSTGRQEVTLYNSRMDHMVTNGNSEYVVPGYDCVATNTLIVTVFFQPRIVDGADMLELLKKDNKRTSVGAMGIDGAGFDALYGQSGDNGFFAGHQAIFEKNGWIVNLAITGASDAMRKEAYKEWVAKCRDSLQKNDAKVFEDTTISNIDMVKHLARRIADKIA
jgi:hypothetical protein